MCVNPCVHIMYARVAEVCCYASEKCKSELICPIANSGCQKVAHHYYYYGAVSIRWKNWATGMGFGCTLPWHCCCLDPNLSGDDVSVRVRVCLNATVEWRCANVPVDFTCPRD